MGNTTATAKAKTGILGVIPFLFILTVALGLLVYIGIGDANRVYTRLHVDKITAFGQIMRNSAESFLNSGFPLRQYVGFDEFTRPLLESEKTIDRIEITGPGNEILFATDRESAQDTGAPETFVDATASLAGEDAAYTVRENGHYYRVTFALESKFGSAGFVSVFTPKQAVGGRIFDAFIIVLIAAGAVIAAFTLLMLLLFRKSGRGTKIGIQLCFAASFIIVAAFTIVALVNIYTEGIQGKSRALAVSLAERLNAALSFNLELSQFTGIDEIFADYRKIDPDINYISLVQGGIILLHTDGSRIRTAEKFDESLFEIKQGLGGSGAAAVSIGLGIPKDKIYAQLLRSGKNFAVLLVSTMFLSILFLNLLFGIRRHRAAQGAAPDAGEENERRLELVKPLYFLATFLEGLFISFLPFFFQQVAAQSQLDQSTAPLLFTIYFAAFVVSLLPTGRIAEKSGIKGLLVCGAFLFTAGYVMLCFFADFYLVVASRVLAGFGQGMIFIGVQSYILRTVSREKKTQGSGIIVFGYNGGMISGTAIGALLVGSLGTRGVFAVASAMGLLLLLYIVFFVQKIPRAPRQTAAAAPARGASLKNLFLILKDFDFIVAILCVGIVTKAILTGVNSFALPLILNKMNFLKEDIGQVIILYSAAVLVSSRFISRIIDKYGNVKRFLFIGTQIGGLALYAMGFAGWDVLASSPFPALGTVVLVAGTVFLGFGHGFIHAPIVTHITEIPAAGRYGAGPVTSIYRLLERIGHVIGPLVVGPLIYGMDLNAFSLSWIGGFSILAGILFMIKRRRQTADARSLSEKN